jgi:hypothetical protein
MSSFYYGAHSSLHSQSAHSQHHAPGGAVAGGGGSGRSRRATRAAQAHQHHQKQQLRALRLQQKEAEESALDKALAARREFELARSFDFEDDELFCPFNLMTDDDLQSMHSGSDRSSLSSGSPDNSPLQQQTQPIPIPSFLLNTRYPALSHQAQVYQPKLHQPLAQRGQGKAIPIVDPSTRNVASPPPSVSPARQQMMQAQHFVPTAQQVW